MRSTSRYSCSCWCRSPRSWFAITPSYLLTVDFTTLAIAFSLQGAFAGAIYGQNPSYLTERFPTEVRATASSFCHHLGAVIAGFLTPILTWFAIDWGYGFALPMLVATSGGLISFGPETKGKVLVADLELARPAEA
jgi:SHS family lactate transporter-like MFS transporter